jgi:hypothetical protein
MLIPNHPDDERLSALASRDADALADRSLTDHVNSCGRCAGLVTELGALRLALFDLPDLQPSRPLRLLPPVETAPAGERLDGWVRRLFAPALTAGAALAMVGLVGTTAPLLGGMASSGGAMPQEQQVSEEAPFERSGAPVDAAAGEGGVNAQESMHALQSVDPLVDDDGEAAGDDDAVADDEGDPTSALDGTAERSVWPMVLFAGVALMIGAALLRWVVVPRAG